MAGFSVPTVALWPAVDGSHFLGFNCSLSFLTLLLTEQKPLFSISSSFNELLSFRSDHESDLRYSTDLCDEEKQFRDKRREVVYEVMKQVLGERAPQNMNEVK